MIDEEEQIHHVRRMFLRRLSCLALSLIYLNLKHRMHILELEYSYSKVTIYVDLCAPPANSTKRRVIYPIMVNLVTRVSVRSRIFLCGHIRDSTHALHDTSTHTTITRDSGRPSIPFPCRSHIFAGTALPAPTKPCQLYLQDSSSVKYNVWYGLQSILVM